MEYLRYLLCLGNKTRRCRIPGHNFRSSRNNSLFATVDAHKKGCAGSSATRPRRGAHWVPGGRQNLQVETPIGPGCAALQNGQAGCRNDRRTGVSDGQSEGSKTFRNSLFLARQTGSKICQRKMSAHFFCRGSPLNSANRQCLLLQFDASQCVAGIGPWLVYPPRTARGHRRSSKVTLPSNVLEDAVSLRVKRPSHIFADACRPRRIVQK